MKRIVRLTESDLTRIVRRVIKESGERNYKLSSIPAGIQGAGMLAVVDANTAIMPDPKMNKDTVIYYYVQAGKHPMTFNGDKVIVSTGKITFELADFTPEMVMQNVDGVTKSTNKYFLNVTGTPATWTWTSSSGKSFTAKVTVPNSCFLSNVAAGGSTAP